MIQISPRSYYSMFLEGQWASQNSSMVLLKVVLPVFLITALGFGIRRVNFVDKFSREKISHLAYFVAVPAPMVLLGWFLLAGLGVRGLDFKAGIRSESPLPESQTA